MQPGISINHLLIEKYNQAVPRYTSYPTVPFWQEGFSASDWTNIFARQFNAHNHTEGISIYIHLPFCEKMCTYCGCNKKITTNHAVEEEYIQAIAQEWKLYRGLMGQTPVIRELHLGGGTPTFFSPANLERLINLITQTSVVHPTREFSVEGHPANTTKEHLEVLYRLGFRRISYGVQDNDEKVQRLINRLQPFSTVVAATRMAREIGFHSVNYDLIYGLPGQTIESIEKTIGEVADVRPDRIAFYSYAHVPWKSRAQRLFDETDLPGTQEKLQLYIRGKELLLQHGYHDIGMDHFALPHDPLYLAWQKGKLHRNFMGYTTQQTALLVGLGVSAISDAGEAYAQNDKTLQGYYQAIKKQMLPITKGYAMTEEDMLFRKSILDIICTGKTKLLPPQQALVHAYSMPLLKQLETDGLVVIEENSLTVTAAGRYFLRNICSTLDMHLARSRNLQSQLFSKAI